MLQFSNLKIKVSILASMSLVLMKSFSSIENCENVAKRFPYFRYKFIENRPKGNTLPLAQ